MPTHSKNEICIYQQYCRYPRILCSLFLFWLAWSAIILMSASSLMYRYFYGRGVDDDKGGVVPALQACTKFFMTLHHTPAEAPALCAFALWVGSLQHVPWLLKSSLAICFGQGSDTYPKVQPTMLKQWEKRFSEVPEQWTYVCYRHWKPTSRPLASCLWISRWSTSNLCTLSQMKTARFSKTTIKHH